MNEVSTELNVISNWLSQRLARGLGLLLVAARYAQETSVERCQLSIGLRELNSVGLCSTDCRWLLIQGLLDHVSETTYPGDFIRSFRNGDAILTDQSCFMLTAAGTDFAENVVANLNTSNLDSTNAGATMSSQTQLPHHPAVFAEMKPRSTSNSTTAPLWDNDRQELWFSGRLIKQYRLPSPNQVAILCAFEEDGWPSRIDDPLPQSPEIDPRRRLNDTIRNLNRSRLSPSIRFSGDGTGQGVLWETEPMTDARLRQGVG